jgi:hypothetical protein
VIQISDRQVFLVALVIALGVIVSAASFTDISVPMPQLFGKSLEAYADGVMDICKDKNYKPSCYDEEIPKLMDTISFEEAFEVTRIVQSLDDSYWYCHVLGHNLSARETSKDLSKWTEVIARTPSGVCSNGAIHGAFQERFRDAEELSDEEVIEILPELRTICEDSDAKVFTGLERASCYHAMGHLIMYITAADTVRAANICDDVTANGREDHHDVCYDGVYMQIFQPLEPEDFALIEGKAPETQEEARQMCDKFDGQKRASCHRESWPMFEEEIKTPEGLTSFCSRNLTKRMEQICYNGMFYVLTPRLDFDEEKISALCEGLSGEPQTQCYGNSASRMIETDYRLQEKAISLCQKAEKYGAGEQCFRELLLYSTYNFHVDSPEFFEFCSIMPEPWKSKCLNKEGYNVKLYSDL